MNYEWDESKNQVNIFKHELDFFDAWEVFQNPILIELDDRFDYGEPRYIAIGLLRDLIVLLIYTVRENDIIRIISFRRAIKYERDRFFKYLQDELGTAEDDG
ncbi:MAG: BrnT family toxin [Pyrinomonadaceae bacterium]